MRTLIALFLLLPACAAQRPQSTPLVDAVRDGDAAAVRALLARGADPDAAAGENGWTPLLHAVHEHRTEAVATLLDGGAGVDRGSSSGMTPLMMAAGYGYDDLVALLLRRGANAERRDCDGDAAVDYALIGMMDVDRMTFFGCQTATAARLSGVTPNTLSSRWARMKGCDAPSQSARS